MTTNESTIWLKSGTYKASQAQPAQINDYHKGIKAYLNLTTKASANLKFGVYGYTPTGTEFTILEATVSSTGVTVLDVHPALSAVGQGNTLLSRNWHLKVTPATEGNSDVYDVSFDLYP